MTDDHWNMILRATALQATGSMDPVRVLALFKDNWDLYNDLKALTLFVHEAEYEALTAKVDAEQIKLDQDKADLAEMIAGEA